MKYHPELFDYKNKLVAALHGADICWMSDYSSIDLVHDDYGLEVCGIKDEDTLRKIVRIFKKTFPNWRFSRKWQKERGRDEGWLYRQHRDNSRP